MGSGGPCFCVSVWCRCGRVLYGWLTSSVLRARARACIRREGDRAAKSRAQIETCERAGRQEAPRCAEEAERAADHGRRGGQHVQGGRKRVTLQCSKRWVESQGGDRDWDCC